MRTDRITCVTSFGKIGIDLYANEMVSSFIQYWPSDVKLQVYLDDINDQAKLPQAPNVEYVLLDDPDMIAFKNRNTNDPRKHGLQSFDDREDSNRFTKNKEGKWKFQYDSIRFCHKVFAMRMCANSGTDVVIWLDGDTKTFAPVTREVLGRWLPQGKFASFLDRPQLYTETGFLMFDMNNPIAKDFFNKWVGYYLNDSIYALPAWTDCHTYDAARKQFDPVAWHDLAPPSIKPGAHVFINGDLGSYMDHMKGKRKLQGKSNASDLFTKRTEKYWNS